MCGITAINTHDNAIPFLLETLKKLEYRGYDSSGISFILMNQIKTVKCKGKIEELKKCFQNEDCHSFMGIGHTRWATHGKPSNQNAHPHMNQKQTFSIVHNGIIENYKTIKYELEQDNYVFESETDSEVIVHLIDKFYNEQQDVLLAFKKATNVLKGSYAIALISTNNPNELFLTRKDSPLVIGKTNGGYFASSDIPTLSIYSNVVFYLNDNEFAVVKKDSIDFYDANLALIDKPLEKIETVNDSSSTEHFETFMHKEIFEQPKIIQKIINNHQLEKQLVDFENIIESIHKVYFVACGTAYHACLSGSYYLEKMTGITTICQTASEFRYTEPLVDQYTLCVFVSQSGETADTLAALKLAKEKQATTISLVNVKGSSLDQLSDYHIYTQAGSEIAVASTKAYTAQLITLLLFSMYYATKLNLPVDQKLMNDLEKLPSSLNRLLLKENLFQQYSQVLINQQDAYFIGRLLDYHVALEGALKLKEISYIHADAYLAGELKHGPIALIEEGTIVFAIATQKQIIDKTISNIEEVKARGGQIVLLTSEQHLSSQFEHVIILDELHSYLMPIISIIPLQLISYHITKFKNLDIDKPRNLAKSVTVE